jgi:hypothetical protein
MMFRRDKDVEREEQNPSTLPKSADVRPGIAPKDPRPLHAAQLDQRQANTPERDQHRHSADDRDGARRQSTEPAIRGR